MRLPRSNRPVPVPTPRCIPDMADVAAYLVPNAPYNPDHSHFEPGDGNDSEEDGIPGRQRCMGMGITATAPPARPLHTVNPHLLSHATLWGCLPVAAPLS